MQETQTQKSAPGCEPMHMFSCPKLSSLCTAPLSSTSSCTHTHILPHHLPPHTEDVIHVVYYIFCDCVVYCPSSASVSVSHDRRYLFGHVRENTLFPCKVGRRHRPADPPGGLGKKTPETRLPHRRRRVFSPQARDLPNPVSVAGQLAELFID